MGQHPKSLVQSGVRPCVVVNNNTNNKYAKVLCVCPCTGNISKNYIPTHVVIEPEDVKGYFEKTSLLLAEQIAKESKATYKVGKLVLVNTEILDKYLELYRLV